MICAGVVANCIKGRVHRQTYHGLRPHFHQSLASKFLLQQAADAPAPLQRSQVTMMSSCQVMHMAEI